MIPKIKHLPTSFGIYYLVQVNSTAQYLCLPKKGDILEMVWWAKDEQFAGSDNCGVAQYPFCLPETRCWWCQMPRTAITKVQAQALLDLWGIKTTLK